MGKSVQARQAEKEWNEKYGNMTAEEREQEWKNSTNKKLDVYVTKILHKQEEYDAKYNLPYGGLIKELQKAEKRIRELEGEPEKLYSTKRAELEKEYDTVQYEFNSNRELWISGEMLKYLEGEEYKEAKAKLQQARNDYAIYLAKKEEWEQENADIINAERIRTKRAELMQADPEALRALGIEPDPVSTPVYGSVSGADADDGKGALREALRSIHPSASDAEIESMVKLV